MHYNFCVGNGVRFKEGVIYDLRVRRCWTLRELAERSGLTTQTVWHAERCMTRPKFVTIRRLAEAFDLDPGELVEKPAQSGRRRKGR